MRIAWLEHMVKEGHVRPAVRDMIYQDCSTVLKVASATPHLEKAIEEKIRGIYRRFEPYVPLAMAYGANKLWGVRAAGKQVKQDMADISATRKAIADHPDFRSEPEKSEARFRELLKIAPTVAKNPDLTLRILKDRLHSGFTSSDVQGLALIQAAYTPDMNKQMALSERTKKASAERLGSAYASIISIVKEAAPARTFNKSFLKTLGQAASNAVVLSTIPILGGIGVGAVKHISDKKDKVEIQKQLAASFEKALTLGRPERDGLIDNKAMAREAFEVLAHFAPHVALQPTAANSYMVKMVAQGHGYSHELDQIRTMSDIQKNYKKTSPFFEGLAAGTHALGLQSGIKSQIDAVGKPLANDVSYMASQAIHEPAAGG